MTIASLSWLNTFNHSIADARPKVKPLRPGGALHI